MKTITNIIRKVVAQASMLVLFGAIVSGVSLTSYASETKVDPIIVKAQFEAVNIDLNAVVEAFKKADLDRMKGLPLVSEVKSEKKVATTYFLYEESDHTLPKLRNIDNWVDLGEDPGTIPCNEPSGIVCLVAFEGSEAEFQTYLTTATYSQMVADGIIEAHKL